MRILANVKHSFLGRALPALLAAILLASCSNSADASSGEAVSAGGETTQTDGQQTDGGENQQDEQDIAQVQKISHSMAVGESVMLYSITDASCIKEINIVQGSEAVSVQGETTEWESWWEITATAAGTAILQFSDADTGAAYVLTITVSAAGGGLPSPSLEPQFYGTWKFTGSNTDGTLTLNANGTGHVLCHAGGAVTHDSDFNWSAREAAGKTYLRLDNLSRPADAQSGIKGEHQISELTDTYFVIKTASGFGFYMPASTKWIKQ